MKTLRLSTLVLLMTSIFFACTKEEYGTPTKEAGAVNATGGSKATASIIEFIVKDNPAYVSSTINVSGKLKFDKAVNQFNCTLQKSTEKDAAGNWINFVDTEYSENVNLGTTGSGPNKVDVTATTFPFEFEFPAEEIGVGETGWRLHVRGGNVNNAWLGNATLVILEDPCVKTFTIDKGVQAVNNGDGTYTFTITYTLTSPEDVAGVKFQGGATSGGQFEHDLIESSLNGLEIVHNNNQNTVLKWEGDLKKCTPQAVSFSYKRKFSCPATDAVVTGEWTAKVGETLIGVPVWATYTCP